MEKQRVRIVDIAEELGLSTATVSNVIHGKTKKISDETVKRVEQKLEEKQYIPSMAGMLLAQNNSKIMGIIINDHAKYEKRVLQDPFINESIDYLAEEMEERGYFMMIKVTDHCEDIVRFSSMWNMEGVIVIGFGVQDYIYLRNRMHIPFAVYDGYFDAVENYANVIIDNISGGKQMGNYFLEQGCRKLLCISDNDLCLDHERYLGFCQAAAEWEIPVEKPKLLLVPVRREERVLFLEEHFREIMEYDGAFAVSDVYAIELMQFLKKRGVRIPEDFGVAGFDDTPICKLVEPELTTVRQDGKLRAKTALDLIEKQKTGEHIAEAVVLPVELVVRESVRKKRTGL